jgi:uncharacterized membrane protein
MASILKTLIFVSATSVALPSALSATTSYQLTLLPSLGGSYSEAVSINSHGVVVGRSTNGAGVIRPTMWRTTIPVDLGTLGGNEGYATSINDGGQVVGQSQTASGTARATL